ncbi:MAG: alkaline phosphatase family protein [Bryobacteraceae bacterium]
MIASKCVAVAAVIAAMAASVGCRRSTAHGRQVIVLGADGMDPEFVERHWSDLPNLSRLRDEGGFRRLVTTTPPQSPVAWSTLITGMDPADHGIFDFVHRDPKTLAPFSSMSRTEEPRFKIPFGPYVFPLSSARVESLRHGRTFWEILSDRGIPVVMQHMPTNFPPVKAGEALAGMGTPDLRGTQGTFTFYTDDPEELAREVPGGRIVKAHGENGRFIIAVEGPPNTLRKDQQFATADLVVDVDPDQAVARLSTGASVTVMKQGEWSEWLRADFPLLGWLAGARGMFRVYAKQLHPRLALYVTPINIDPRSPDLPISAPSSYSRTVADRTGPFYTQGIAEDTSAYRQGVFTMEEFLRQSTIVRDDELKLLRYSLDHFREGLLFFYFSSTDQNAHMLWGKHEPELLEVYRAVDSAIGETLRRFPNADVIVMSDHGFTSFDRAVNLNTWLWQQGYLVLQGPPGGDDVGFTNVDWSRTQAYGLGLNGLYLNVAGREKNGIVAPAEAAAIERKLIGELTQLRDPANGRQVVEVVSTPHAAAGPDMIVGYARGYRASWQTALGGITPALLEDNTDAWIGDHCINAADVPGVLFSNRRIRADTPVLKDITVTILGLFGAGPGAGMHGKSVL